MYPLSFEDFIRNNKENIIHTDIDDPEAIKRLGWQLELYPDLLKVQRYLRMGCDVMYVIHLLEKEKGKFQSASEIAKIPLAELVDLLGSNGNHPGTAEKIHQLATIRRAQAELLRLGEIQGTDPYLHATRFQEGAWNEVKQRRYETLHGPSGKPAHSVLSPRAYFQSLRKLREQIRDAPSPFRFADRRGDVQELDPLAPFIEDPIPYQEVVNAVLERQLTGDVYQEIATARYPFNLPFHLPLTQTAQYLSYLGTDLVTFYGTFARQQDPLTAAQAQLQLSGEELEYLTTEQETAVALAPFWGLESTPDRLVETVSSVPWFLQATGLTRAELEDLLFRDLHDEEREDGASHRFFVNGAGLASGFLDVLDERLTWLVPGGEVRSLTLGHCDRLHRFIRLSRKLGWSFSELEDVLSSFGTLQDTTAIVAIAATERLRRKLGVPIDVLCSFWSDLKSSGLGNRPAFAFLDLFDRVFNNQIARDYGTYIAQQDRPWLHALYEGKAKPYTKDDHWRPRLAAALGISKEDVQRIEAHAGPAEDPLALSHLSRLYRLARIPQSLGLSVEDFLLLLDTFYADHQLRDPRAHGAPWPTIALLEQLAEVAAWLRKEGLSVPELRSLCTGATDRRVPPLLSDEETAHLGDTLRHKFQNVLVTPNLFESGTVSPAEAQALFDNLLKAGFIDEHGLVLGLPRGSDPMVFHAKEGRSWLQETLPQRDVPEPLAGYHFWRFDRTEERFLDCGDKVDLRDKSFTIEIWARPEGHTDREVLFSQAARENDFSPSGTLHVRFDRPVLNDHRLFFGFFENDQFVSERYFPPDGCWHHWTFVYDQTAGRDHQKKIFVDGQEVQSGGGGIGFGAPYRGSGPLWIGRSRHGLEVTPTWFTGFIGEVRIWDSVRSPEQIRAALTRPLGMDAEGLLGYWRPGLHPGFSALETMASRQEQTLYRALSEAFHMPDEVVRQVCGRVRDQTMSDPAFVASFMAPLLEGRPLPHGSESGAEPSQRIFLKLCRLIQIIQRTGLGQAEALAVLDRPERCGIDWSKDLTLASFRSLCQIRDLAALFASPEHPFVRYFALEHPADAASELSAITGWKRDEIEKLLTLVPAAEHLRTSTVLRVVECFTLANRLGAAPGVLREKIWDRLWSGPRSYAAAKEAAQTLLGILSGKAGGEGRDLLADSLRRTLDRRRRDALLGRVLHHLRTRPENPLPHLETPRELYEHLLIDVEMGEDAVTSRLAEATACLQLFIHRCRMHLELDVVVNPALEQIWSVLRSYRIWEAKMRLMLFPENYLKPELREGKSPQFLKLEGALQQTDITDAKIEEAFKEYLHDFTEIAHLEIVGDWVHADPQSAENGSLDKILLLVGRTRTSPARFFLRQARFADGTADVWWEPWEEVKVNISARRVFPVYVFGKIFLVWATVREERDGETFRYTAELSYCTHDFNHGWGTPQKVGVVELERGAQISGPWPESWSEIFLLPKAQRDALLVLHQPFATTGDTTLFFKRAFKIGSDMTVEVEQETLEVPVATVSNDLPHVNGEEILKSASPLAGRPLRNQPDWFFFQLAGANLLIKPNRHKQTSAELVEQNPTTYWDSLPYSIHYPGFSILRLDSGAASVLSRRLMTGGLRSLLSLESQRTRELPVFKDLALGDPGAGEVGYRKEHGVRPVPTGEHLGFEDANGLYYWEIFFHAPLLLADRLNTAQHFEQAQAWYDAIYNPTIKQNPWQFLPLLREASQQGTGTLHNTAWVNDSVPIFPSGSGEVLRFDGSSAYVVFDGAIDLADRSFTIELWAKWSTVDAEHRRILSHGAEAGLNKLLHIYAKNVSDATEIHFDLWANSLVAKVDPKRWHHWAFVVSQEAQKRVRQIFCDGILMAEQTMNAPYMGQGPICLGKIPWEADCFFAGSLTDVRVWMYARSGFEIQRDKDHRLTGGEPGLFRYWPLEKVEGGQVPNLTRSEDLSMPLSPFDPHAIARFRPVAYRKAIAMRYIDNLLDHGDMLFRRYTRESVTEAMMFYVMASDLLGKRPESPVPAESAPTMDSAPGGAGHLVIPFEDRLSLTAASSVEHWTGASYLLTLLDDFHAPDNDFFCSYWDRVEDRLYKIRHSLNIDGIKQQLPLYEPALDPELLLRGGSAWAGGGDGLALLDTAVPHYRFTAMLARAQSFAARVAQLGAALLSALEKKDAEQLGLLRNTHEQVVLQMNRELKKLQAREAQENVAALEAGLRNAGARAEHYTQLLQTGLSGFEIAQITTMSLGQAFSQASMVMDELAAIGFMIPQLGAPTAITFGGQQIGASLQATSHSLKASMELFNFASNLCSLLGGFHRRAQDWQLQKRLAEHDAEQIGRQIEAARTQVQIAGKDLEVLEKTIEQNRAIDELLTGKFTNQELYQWMAGKLAALYFQSYQMAHDLALAAQKAFQFEQTSDATFITGASWDNLKKGLLAGERLQVDLDRMEKAHLDRNVRRLEIEKTISLLELDPLALLKLQQEGSCQFHLTELLFDLDFPGHYCRQIKWLTLSFPAVVGPYQNINATLSQIAHRTLIKADAQGAKFLLRGEGQPPASIRQNWRPSQQVALSRGLNDGGLFELVFQDERYLPFEGTGAVSSWNLEVNPHSIDLHRLSDVILKLEYSALPGGTELETAVLEELATVTSRKGRLFSLERDFPAEWRQFLASSSTPKAMSFRTGRTMYPPVKNPTLKQVALFLELTEEGKKELERSVLQLQIGAAAPFDLELEAGSAEKSPTGGPAFQDVAWTLTDPTGKLAGKNVKNLLIAVIYEGQR